MNEPLNFQILIFLCCTIRHAFSPFINLDTANREVTHPVPPTNHSASDPPSVHRRLPWFPPQTTAPPLLLLPPLQLQVIMPHLVECPFDI
ncbi:hypothetical protein TNCV_206941 [Trichonephila clavipes]|nr:hypothetical protein TNCV_206941 [Trichonephila clavipes]